MSPLDFSDSSFGISNRAVSVRLIHRSLITRVFGNAPLKQPHNLCVFTTGVLFVKKEPSYVEGDGVALET